MTRSKFLYIMTISLLSRLSCGLFVYLGHMQRPFLSPVPGGWEGIRNWWLNPWTTYDSKWYLDIALNGYQEHTTAFFPLYPLLLRFGGKTELGMALAGFLISNVCFILALWVLYMLTENEYGEKEAAIVVFLLAFFPTTAFFSAVYTESLFLLLITLSFYWVRKHHWVLAGFFGILASLTRNPGFLIFAALGIEYYSYIKKHEFNFRYIHIISIFLPLAGFAAVQLYFWSKFSGPLAGIHSQQFYYRALGWPWEPIINEIINISTFDLLTLLNLTVVILVFILIVKYRNILRPSYGLLLLGVILMHLTYQRIIPPYTIGAARYMSTTFPFVFLLAITFRDFRQSGKVILTSIYLFFCALTSYTFGLKGFLG